MNVAPECASLAPSENIGDAEKSFLSPLTAVHDARVVMLAVIERL